MATVYVIQTGRTTWEDQRRMESVAGSPLTAQGTDRVQACAKELSQHKISVIYAGAGEAEQQTAALVAGVLGAKVRTQNKLREIDYGMWQGLTRDEIQRRQPKVYRQWRESPVSVRPPGGESLEEARTRLCEAMQGILKRHKNGSALLVLRPVALGVLRCVLDGVPLTGMWAHVDPDFTWGRYETNDRSL